MYRENGFFSDSEQFPCSAFYLSYLPILLLLLILNDNIVRLKKACFLQTKVKKYVLVVLLQIHFGADLLLFVADCIHGFLPNNLLAKF
jgi:hypothetical protein